MGYRIVSIMPQLFFESFFKEYKDTYEPIEDSDIDMSEYDELHRVSDGLPKDARFVEYRINPRDNNSIELVFESEEWGTQNNFDYIDIEFESITLEKSEIENLGVEYDE